MPARTARPHGAAAEKPGAGRNQAAGTVTVRGPLGHFVAVKLKLLVGVKVGDQMKLTFTQAVAVQPMKQ